MKVLGITLRKNELHYTVIEGEMQKEATLLEIKKINIRVTESVPELMDWFESSYKEILAKYTPDKVAYKLHLNTIKDQMTYLQFPMGVLNLVCHREGIPTISRSTSYVTAQRKTIAKNYFQQFKDNLKDTELDALVVAWSELER